MLNIFKAIKLLKPIISFPKIIIKKTSKSWIFFIILTTLKTLKNFEK